MYSAFWVGKLPWLDSPHTLPGLDFNRGGYRTPGRGGGGGLTPGHLSPRDVFLTSNIT